MYLNDLDLKIIRSQRKTISLEITRQGSVLVRAPEKMTGDEIRAFVESRSEWIRKHLEKVRRELAETPQYEVLTTNEMRGLISAALKDIPQRVERFAPMVGVSYGRITIRAQKTRWGSCSSKGNLSFNCLLMRTPPEVLDSVVVHELCHIKQMNHSPKFYMEVERVYPEYDRWHRWLDEHGGVLLSRLRSSEQ